MIRKDIPAVRTDTSNFTNLELISADVYFCKNFPACNCLLQTPHVITMTIWFT